MSSSSPIGRRRFLIVAGGGVLAIAGCTKDATRTSPAATSGAVGADDPAVAAAEAARSNPAAAVTRYDLTASSATLTLGRREVETWAYNQMLPGPELRVTAGDILEVAIRNDLPEDTTIHWHGLALRNDMDGVHDLTQPPILSGESFTYRFTVPDPGTYWFHPHMGLQLDRALYAPLVVEERANPGRYDIDQVIVLDDWLDGVGGGTPEETFKTLTGMHGGMNMGGTEMGDGAMGMFSSDLLGGDAGDVDYPLHLLNGRPLSDRPTISVPAGARARLRFINAGSDTAYRVAVGGNRMTVTHADGFPIEPIEVDALLIGMGERYDVMVEPASGAWPLVALAEGKDRSAAAIIRTSDAAASAVPPVDARPAEFDGQLLSYRDLHATDAVRLDSKTPDVDETIRLTGSMMPYSWAFDGAAFPDQPPIAVRQGQRVA